MALSHPSPVWKIGLERRDRFFYLIAVIVSVAVVLIWGAIGLLSSWDQGHDAETFPVETTTPAPVIFAVTSTPSQSMLPSTDAVTAIPSLPTLMPSVSPVEAISTAKLEMPTAETPTSTVPTLEPDVAEPAAPVVPIPAPTISSPIEEVASTVAVPPTEAEPTGTITFTEDVVITPSDVPTMEPVIPEQSPIAASATATATSFPTATTIVEPTVVLPAESSSPTAMLASPTIAATETQPFPSAEVVDTPVP